MANRIAALEGQKACQTPLFPIYIVAAGVSEDCVVGLTGAGLAIDRGLEETVDALKDRAHEMLGDKPRLPVILSYLYDNEGSPAR